MDQANVLIIGGGVIGCAIAREVSQRWQDVFLVEQFPKVGMATSTRNSGVIHSGIYYPKGSLKARHCVEGNRLSYEFCAKHNVPFRKTGKLVVAANAGEEHELEALAQRGRDNGVEHLTIVGPKEIQAREPHIRGTAALDVPSAGILSAEDLVRTHARLATDNGANIVTRAKVVALTATPWAVRVDLEIGDEDGVQKESIEARCVINAAGLFADEDLSGTWGILRNSRGAHEPDQQFGLSAAAPRWVELGRTLYEDSLGHGFAWPNSYVCRRKRQLRARPTADS
jgi:L-2-hydroxyglutarate oxidase LhgO